MGCEIGGEVAEMDRCLNLFMSFHRHPPTPPQCQADLPPSMRLGRVEVSCEGYTHPDDTNVLKGQYQADDDQKYYTPQSIDIVPACHATPHPHAQTRAHSPTTSSQRTAPLQAKTTICDSAVQG